MKNENSDISFAFSVIWTPCHKLGMSPSRALRPQTNLTAWNLQAVYHTPKLSIHPIRKLVCDHTKTLDEAGGEVTVVEEEGRGKYEGDCSGWTPWSVSVRKLLLVLGRSSVNSKLSYPLLFFSSVPDQFLTSHLVNLLRGVPRLESFQSCPPVHGLRILLRCECECMQRLWFWTKFWPKQLAISLNHPQVSELQHRCTYRRAQLVRQTDALRNCKTSWKIILLFSQAWGVSWDSE